MTEYAGLIFFVVVKAGILGLTLWAGWLLDMARKEKNDKNNKKGR